MFGKKRYHAGTYGKKGIKSKSFRTEKAKRKWMMKQKRESWDWSRNFR